MEDSFSGARGSRRISRSSGPASHEQEGGQKHHGEKQSWTEMDRSRTPFPELRRAYRFYNETSGKSRLSPLKWYDERLELFERFLGADP
jgi:hypothetical protein